MHVAEGDVAAVVLALTLHGQGVHMYLWSFLHNPNSEIKIIFSRFILDSFYLLVFLYFF